MSEKGKRLYKIGAKGTCLHCGQPIVFLGTYWKHEQGNPRHQGQPVEKKAK